jgi:hypothetical protein
VVLSQLTTTSPSFPLPRHVLLNRSGSAATLRSMPLQVCSVTLIIALEIMYSSGSNIELGLTGIDVIALHSGAFLCDPESPIRSVTLFTARIVTFALEYPVIQGMEVSGVVGIHRICNSFMIFQGHHSSPQRNRIRSHCSSPSSDG